MVWSFRSPNGGGWQSFTQMSDNLSSYGTRLCLFLAAILVGLGILVLAFPRIVAFLIAGLFFLGAFFFLKLAWTLLRRPKAQPPFPQDRVHVEVYDSTSHNDDAPPAQLP